MRGVREVQLFNNKENWRGTFSEREISPNFWKTETSGIGLTITQTKEEAMAQKTHEEEP